MPSLKQSRITISNPGALSYAELGTLILKSGGEYRYLMGAFGPVTAFLYSWASNIILRPSSVAIIVLACAEYMMEAIYNDGCEAPIVTKKCLAVFCLCESAPYSAATFSVGYCDVSNM